MGRVPLKPPVPKHRHRSAQLAQLLEVGLDGDHAHLGAGVLAYKLGRSWRVRFPLAAA